MVLGVVINAIDAAGAAAGANGLNVTLDGQLAEDIKSIAAAFKSALPTVATPATKAALFHPAGVSGGAGHANR